MTSIRILQYIKGTLQLRYVDAKLGVANYKSTAKSMLAAVLEKRNLTRNVAVRYDLLLNVIADIWIHRSIMLE